MAESVDLIVEGMETSDREIEEIFRALGQAQAFGLVATGSEGARMQVIARLKEAKAHKRLGLDWDAFCSQRLGMAPRTVRRRLGELKELGAEYFALKEAARIEPGRFRALTAAGAAIEDGALVIAGEAVEIKPENREHILEIVQDAEARAKEMSSRASTARHEARRDRELAKSVEKERDELRAKLELETDARKRALAGQSERSRSIHEARVMCEAYAAALEAIRRDGGLDDELRAERDWAIGRVIQAAGESPFSPVEMDMLEPLEPWAPEPQTDGGEG